MTAPRATARDRAGHDAQPVPGQGRAPRSDAWWRWLAGAEVGAVVAAVATDWAIPAVVVVVLAALSLLLRRRGPGSLGFHRVSRPWRLAAQMAVFAVGWTLLNVAVLIPVTNHLSGTRQDVSAFADLEGNLGLLALYLSASWVLGAFCEEVAFRGYLLTRLTDILGPGGLQQLAGVLGSSLLFGMLHTEQGIVGVIAAALAGAVFCVLRYRYRTLWAPILAHGFDDTIGFTWFYFVGPFYGLW